ncbi:Putative inorganic phosphate cotransporter [Gryllus bimaculatus]|nr:Putative inorganic phosphate cotransporter [Gryllus bimaculatus]
MVFDVVMVMVMVIGAALGTVAATHLSIVIHVVVVVVVVAVVIWAALGTVAAKHLSMVLDVVVVVMVMLMMVMVVVAVVTGAALGTVAATHLSAWAAAALSWRWSFLLAAVACVPWKEQSSRGGPPCRPCDFGPSSLRISATTAGDSLVPSACLLGIAFLGCDTRASLCLATVAVTFIGALSFGVVANPMHLAPNFGGPLISIVNFVAAIPGTFLPFVVGIIIEDSAKLLNWIPLLYALFGLYVLMFLAFGLGGTCEEQWWNNPKDDKTS